MPLKLGLHVGPQEISMAELTRLWRRADEAGFHWISTWDHFYANPIGTTREPCFEGVASMAALAAVTKKARVGCLVFCALFRSPGVLAKAAVTIDHISNGRAEIGMGAGWFQEEFEDFGYSFPPIKERLDQLEEGLQVVRSLLREDSTTFKGRYYNLEGAVCTPKPLQEKLRIWVGGRGEKRTPRIAAQYADGFSVPYLDPDQLQDRYQTLKACCERMNRDPADVERSVNLRFLMGADEGSANRKREQASKKAEKERVGNLYGTVQEATDRLGEYMEVGAQGVNIAIRPPVDWDAFEAYIEEVMPHFHEA